MAERGQILWERQKAMQACTDCSKLNRQQQSGPARGPPQFGQKAQAGYPSADLATSCARGKDRPGISGRAGPGCPCDRHGLCFYSGGAGKCAKMPPQLRLQIDKRHVRNESPRYRPTRQ